MASNGQEMMTRRLLEEAIERACRIYESLVEEVFERTRPEEQQEAERPTRQQIEMASNAAIGIPRVSARFLALPNISLSDKIFCHAVGSALS